MTKPQKIQVVGASIARPYNEGMFLKYAALSLLLSGAIRFFHKKEKYGGIFAVFYW